jgi:arylsulfatase A-like enzyme
LYDGGAQVPYFVKWPKVIAKDQVCSEYVANIDVAPTLLEMARFSVEDPFDGVSIYSLLKGNKEPVRQHLMLEVGYGRAIMTKDWKYIALRFPDFELPEIEKQGGLTNVNYNASSASKNFRKNGVRYYPQHYYDFDQLYDRKQDAREQNNLFKNPEYAPQLKKMKTLLAQSLEKMPHTFAEIKPKK